MEYFIDSASIGEIKEAASLGVLDGVTTNPSLVAKTGKPFAEVAKEICEFVNGPVSLEVVGTTAEDMVKEAKELRRFGSNVVVKIPMMSEGLKAVKRLSSEGIPTNVTLIFQPLQALLAAKAGASYVSPFIGRLDDIGQNGLDLVQDILTIFRQYHLKTKVLAASVRHPTHVLECAKMGAHVVTLPVKVIHQLTKHPLTDSGLKTFLEDWKKVQN
ncbi:MAG: fructose-6-phosphate aldolase [Deltaproteobacteria bacterium]|nr:fructose-6-phosphate aldolase [Deltaproteobacteria bacterium]